MSIIPIRFTVTLVRNRILNLEKKMVKETNIFKLNKTTPKKKQMTFGTRPALQQNLELPRKIKNK